MATVTSVILPNRSLPAKAPARSRFYVAEFDVLRLVAFLLVFGRHVGSSMGFITKAIAKQHSMATGKGQIIGSSLHCGMWFAPQEIVQSLDFGVSLFFFLSAFLITRLLLIERSETGGIQVRSFYLRRLLRIWPLYFCFLGLIVLLSTQLDVLHVSTPRLLAAFFFVSNWAVVLHGWSGMAIQPLWSVAIEEQFYVIWPWFARHGRQAVVYTSWVFIGVAVVTLIYCGNRVDAQVTATWPNTLVQSLFLGSGALTACFSFPEKKSRSGMSRAAFGMLGGLCWVTASSVFHIVRTQSPGAASLVAGYALVLIGTLLIFHGIAGWKGSERLPWLTYMGKISYGLYVFHVACLLLAEQAVQRAATQWRLGISSPYLLECMSAGFAMVLTVFCAMVSYRWLERPFLQLKERFSAVRSRHV